MGDPCAQRRQNCYVILQTWDKYSSRRDFKVMFRCAEKGQQSDEHKRTISKDYLHQTCRGSSLWLLAAVVEPTDVLVLSPW